MKQTHVSTRFEDEELAIVEDFWKTEGHKNRSVFIRYAVLEHIQRKAQETDLITSEAYQKLIESEEMKEIQASGRTIFDGVERKIEALTETMLNFERKIDVSEMKITELMLGMLFSYFFYTHDMPQEVYSEREQYAEKKKNSVMNQVYKRIAERLGEDQE